MVSKKGIDYESLDDSPVHLVFMLFYPKNFVETSLQIFKKLAKILEDANFRQEILSQNSAHGIYDVLCRYENLLGE